MGEGFHNMRVNSPVQDDLSGTSEKNNIFPPRDEFQCSVSIYIPVGLQACARVYVLANLSAWHTQWSLQRDSRHSV